MGLFSKYFEKRGLFSKYFEKIPLASPRPEEGVFFQNIWKTEPFFSKYLEKRPIYIFLIDTFHFFQITIIYRGTQVTIDGPWCS